MNIFLSDLNESWVVDRFRKDWYSHNPEISTNDIRNSDIIWIISPWVWKKLSKKMLSKKVVICSIYHIDFESFKYFTQQNFAPISKPLFFIFNITNLLLSNCSLTLPIE